MITSPSTRFSTALTASHKRVVRVRVCPYVDEAYAPVEPPLIVSSGTMTIDSSANTWRQATLEIAIPPAGTAERTAYDLLNVQSAEIIIETGIDFGGSIDYVTVGQLRVEEISAQANNGKVRLVAYDRGIRVSDFGLVTVYTPLDTSGAKLTYVNAIKDLIKAAFPAEGPPTFTVVAGVDTASVPPDATIFEGDRWDAINKLADAIAAYVHNDNLGNFVITPAENSTTPNLSITSGSNGTLVEATADRTRRDQYNAIALSCESPSGPSIFVYLVDKDPASPTFYGGPFGKKAKSERNDTITTEVQAIDAARGILTRYKGSTRQISLGSFYNPLLLPRDVVRVTLPGESYEDHVVESVELPLSPGSGQMRIGTKLNRQVSGFDV